MSYLAGAILYKALNGDSFSLVLCCFANVPKPCSVVDSGYSEPINLQKDVVQET